jgi:hypothetical protein
MPTLTANHGVSIAPLTMRPYSGRDPVLASRADRDANPAAASLRRPGRFRATSDQTLRAGLNP